MTMTTTTRYVHASEGIFLNFLLQVKNKREEEEEEESDWEYSGIRVIAVVAAAAQVSSRATSVQRSLY